MAITLNRRAFLAATGAAGLMGAALLGGCAGAGGASSGGQGSQGGGSQTSGAQASSAAEGSQGAQAAQGPLVDARDEFAGQVGELGAQLVDLPDEPGDVLGLAALAGILFQL